MINIMTLDIICSYITHRMSVVGMCFDRWHYLHNFSLDASNANAKATCIYNIESLGTSCESDHAQPVLGVKNRFDILLN